MDKPVAAEPREETLTVQNDPMVMQFFFPPQGEWDRAVIIVPAMGVSQRYYAPLATWLAENGMLTATFDYRGMGKSRTRPLPKLDVDVLSWAQHDAEAALGRVRDVAGEVPISWIGHSLGGQILPMVPSHREVSRVVTVAAGSGYWRENVPQLKRFSWLLWFVIVPLAIPLLGYFPGRRLRMIGDLPAGVMRQWRRWVLNAEYAVGVEGPEMRAKYASVDVPITGFSFTDDEYLSERNIESLHGFYTGAKVLLHRVVPREVGLSRIGHHGFFRAANRDALWEPLLLAALTGAEVPAAAIQPPS
ncbi:MAG: alpha/beta fold hydrolase [Pseudomonadota bacterium]